MENCAILAHEAGVDCIEVHGDRLVGSLCSPILNHRTDEYGGDLANRTRFALTLVKRLKTIVPDILLEKIVLEEKVVFHLMKLAFLLKN